MSETTTELRAEMSEIRQRMADQVACLASTASELKDWKLYVRSCPWTSCALAAFAGYLLVPRKRRAATVDDQSISKLASLVQGKEPQGAGATSGSLVQSLLGMATSSIGKLVAAKAGQIAMNRFASWTSNGHHQHAKPEFLQRDQERSDQSTGLYGSR